MPAALSIEQLAKIFAGSLADHFLRYVIFAGVAFLFFYVLRAGRRWAPKIQPRTPAAAEMRREILLSLVSLAIFALTAVLVAVLYRAGWTQLYPRIAERGVPWLIASTALLIFAHDAWFYWTHRLLHRPRFFALVHRVHHLSHTPTPWAAFAFHPVEAFVQAVFFPLIVLVLPVHPLAGLVWLLYMTGMNVLGHCGFEVLPRGLARHWLGKWHNTTTHHDMHHRLVRCNFGLYFNLWDRLMRTNYADYEREFDRVKNSAGAPAK